MSIPDPPFKRLGIHALFLVWGVPHGTTRSKLMGEQLGMDVQYICFTKKRGRSIAPIKYFFQTVMTLAFLIRHNYQLIFVQDPAIFAVLPVYIYGLFSKARFIIDSHTDALQASWWKWTMPLHRFMGLRAITTIVTNDELRKMIEGWGNHVFTLESPPIQFNISKPSVLPASKFNVVMVSTASYDEPIEEVLKVASSLPEVDIYITGDFEHSINHRGVMKNAPDNVYFTGYLREDDYVALLSAADAIMCLTTEDNTFLSGNNEALWLGKPLITSNWLILRRYFNKGTICIDNSVEQIRQSLLNMRQNLGTYREEMYVLQAERRRDWWEKISQLIDLIQQAMKIDSQGTGCG